MLPAALVDGVENAVENTVVYVGRCTVLDIKKTKNTRKLGGIKKTTDQFKGSNGRRLATACDPETVHIQT